jgi:hypothetical protein
MLAERGLQLESIGGDIVGVPISALKVKKIVWKKLIMDFLSSYRISILINYWNQS